MQESIFSVWLAGFSLSFSLIVSIGAQNLFLLRQSVRRQYIWECALFCILSDALLMILGVGGMARLLENSAALAWWMGLVAVAFLVVYGLLCLRRAWVDEAALEVGAAAADAAAGQSCRAVLMMLAAMTFLNPHVYLDTVLLLGTMGAREAGVRKWVFVLGAVSASALWFGLICAAGARLRGFFASVRAWRVLDAITGAMMLALAWWVYAGLDGAQS